MNDRAAFIRCLIGASLFGAISAMAQPASLGAPCERLARLDLRDTEITQAAPVSGGVLDPDGAGPQPPLTNLPPFCRVAGTIRPTSDSEIKFEVWLPLARWNGKLNGVGNGGFAGVIAYPAMAGALARGYAAVSTDTGHVGGDASWALGHPQKVIDFGPRSLHLTTLNGKAIVREFYRVPARYAYYTGCSTGGRQGLMEAQQFPHDYDGLVVGAPANSWTHLLAGAAWTYQARLNDLASYFPASQLPLIADAVNAECDAADGIADGVLDDPRRCDFKPASLQCAPAQDPSTCLTAKQVTALEKIYAGPRNPRTGERIFPGLLPGAETGPNGWALWITGPAPGGAFADFFATQYFKFFVFQDPVYDVRTYNFDSDQAFNDASIGKVVNAIDPDLRRLQDRGGKIIMFHGWNDPAIPAVNSINYYESVVSLAKARGRNRAQALAEVQDFFRFFLAPGMQHCSGGPGPSLFDPLAALESWVEQGKAPNRMIAARITAGVVDRTRPLCVYPKTAVYRGSGSTDDAKNFSCRDPRAGHRSDPDDED